MHKNNKFKYNINLLYKFIILLIVAWTIIITGSLIWSVYQGKSQMEDLAKHEALIHFNRDISFRRWGSMHGGVYVPVTNETQPNPYLKFIPERDITTPSGKKLTLMNPAYMVKQMWLFYSSFFSAKGHITSLKLLNPANKPDEWERYSLKSFEKGATERLEFTKIDNKPYLRLMRPLFIEKSCLKCHSHQGYKVGEVRGGISISIPMEPYITKEKEYNNTLYLSHGLIWFFGTGILIFVLIQGKQRIIEQKVSQIALQQSEQQYSIITELSPVGILQTDADGHCIYVNERWSTITGFSQNDALGNGWLKGIHYDDNVNVSLEWYNAVLAGQNFTFEYRFKKPNGKIIWVFSKSTPFHDESKRIIGHIVTIMDITDRKRSEEEQKENTEKLLSAMKETIQAMAMMVEVRDPYTAGHQKRVAKLAISIATEMNLPQNQIEGIHLASLIHDIGKIQVPAEILNKPTKLHDIEYQLVQTHTQVGYEIIKTIDFPWPIADIIHEHHEKLDGSGYPNGLTDRKIRLEAKIICVADVIDAMISHRPYRPAYTLDYALNEIYKYKGRFYDENVVDICFKLFKEKNFQLD
ncbi:MAG: DUF3365 domain-containing protein [Spirochaetota bacterium]|nr:DUF3365 domain-containing protein [Spirochaetota bacterium]